MIKQILLVMGIYAAAAGCSGTYDKANISGRIVREADTTITHECGFYSNPGCKEYTDPAKEYHVMEANGKMHVAKMECGYHDPFNVGDCVELSLENYSGTRDDAYYLDGKLTEKKAEKRLIVMYKKVPCPGEQK